MEAKEVEEYVAQQIDKGWIENETDGVDIRSLLVKPHKVKMIERIMQDGNMIDLINEVWVVLEERADKSGYTIFFDDVYKQFGLATVGFKEDPHPVILGLIGDFWTTFNGM